MGSNPTLGSKLMNKHQQHEVVRTIEQEGFDYAFDGYTSFEEIKDEKFHKLREAYVKSKQKLELYIDFDTVYDEVIEGRCPDNCPCDGGDVNGLVC